MSLEQYNEARQTIIHVVLGTDMKYHFDHLTKFKTRRGSDAFEAPERKDLRLLLSMCLHSADVGNPAKPWQLSCEWSARVMDEFFRQGDTEMERGLPVSPFMDRSKTDIAKCQIGFIKCAPHLPRTPATPALRAPRPCNPSPLHPCIPATPAPLQPRTLAPRPSRARRVSLSPHPCARRSRSILIKPYFEEWGHFLGASGTQLTDNIAANIERWETEGENALGEERAALIKAKPVPKPKPAAPVVAEATNAPVPTASDRSSESSAAATHSSPVGKRAALLAARVAAVASPSFKRSSARS